MQVCNATKLANEPIMDTIIGTNVIKALAKGAIIKTQF